MFINRFESKHRENVQLKFEHQGHRVTKVVLTYVLLVHSTENCLNEYIYVKINQWKFHNALTFFRLLTV